MEKEAFSTWYKFRFEKKNLWKFQIGKCRFEKNKLFQFYTSSDLKKGSKYEVFIAVKSSAIRNKNFSIKQ